MGLDVGLIRYIDKEKSDKKFEQFQREEARLVQEHLGSSSVREVEPEALQAYNEAKDRLCKKLGVNDWGESERYKETITIDSKKHPHHLFKIGYLRSSYNSSGFNSVVEDSVGMSLYDVFPESEDGSFEFSPDWENSLIFANKMLRKLKGQVKENPYMTTEVSSVIYGKKEDALSSGKEALEAFVKAKKEHKGKEHLFKDYSNASGYFFMGDPIKVRAALTGTSITGRPAIYLVYEDPESLEWYVQATEVVVEMIKWVLNQPKPEQYYLSWSG